MPTPEMPGLHSSKNWIQTHHSPHSELKPTHQTQIQHHDSSDFTIRHHPVIHLNTFGKITSLKETFKLGKCKMDMGRKTKVKKILVTSASLLGTSALLVVTRSY